MSSSEFSEKTDARSVYDKVSFKLLQYYDPVGQNNFQFNGGGELQDPDKTI